MPRNCLTHALDTWRAEGGYVAWRRSEHWQAPHMLHVSSDGRISSYVPPTKLNHPLQALAGFGGEIRASDPVELARPMTTLGIVAGAWLLAGGVTIWTAKRIATRAWRWIRSRRA